MVPIASGGYYLRYIKKEDGRELADSQKNSVAFPLVFFPIMSLINLSLWSLVESVHPQSALIYATCQYLIAAIGIAMIISGIFSWRRKVDYKAIDAKLAKYKDGEMINVRDLLDKKAQKHALWAMLAGVVYMLASIVLPIFLLTV